MAAKEHTPPKMLFDVRISGQVEAPSLSEAAEQVAAALSKMSFLETANCKNCANELEPEDKYCPKCGKAVLPYSGPLVEGGIFRLTPAKGA